MTQKQKKNYVAPQMHVLQLSTQGLIAGSITGSAPDSDDSEFGTSNHHNQLDFNNLNRGETWNHEWE